jgi:hypothetical protein
MKNNESNEVKEETQAGTQVFAEVPRSETEIIRVSTREYKGVPYVDIRVFFKDQEGEYRPTKKGITVKEDQIHEVAKGVCLAEEALVA